MSSCKCRWQEPMHVRQPAASLMAGLQCAALPELRRPGLPLQINQPAPDVVAQSGQASMLLLRSRLMDQDVFWPGVQQSVLWLRLPLRCTAVGSVVPEAVRPGRGGWQPGLRGPALLAAAQLKYAHLVWGNRCSIPSACVQYVAAACRGHMHHASTLACILSSAA